MLAQYPRLLLGIFTFLSLLLQVSLAAAHQSLGSCICPATSQKEPPLHQHLRRADDESVSSITTSETRMWAGQATAWFLVFRWASRLVKETSSVHDDPFALALQELAFGMKRDADHGIVQLDGFKTPLCKKDHDEFIKVADSVDMEEHRQFVRKHLNLFIHPPGRRNFRIEEVHH